jgi:UDP-N-acetylmuramoyl-tripeptide--D-alanyl-D-alanine ligase
VGALAERTGARIVAVGDGARGLAVGAATERDTAGGPQPLWFPDIDSAAATLTRLLRPGDAVLVKASRAVGLERIAGRLLETLPSVLTRPADESPAAGVRGEEC